MRTRGQAGTQLDTSLISASFNLDEGKLQLLLDAPTTELVKDFLLGLTHKAQEFGDDKADKLRHDIEVENTIRNHEARAKALKSSLTKSQRELEEQRQTVTALETSRAQLQSEIDNHKSDSSDSSSEVVTLKSQITSLEASNRDTLSLLEAKSAAHDSLAEELTAQHQKIISLRREVSALEDKNQSLENAASALRFREQALLQEIELLKRNIHWHEQELKTRTEESSRVRKEKNAQIQELQRNKEDATSAIDTHKRTESALRQRCEEISQKYEDALVKDQKMQEAAIQSEAAFRTELESARRLVDLQRQSAETARARLHQVETDLEKVRDAAAEEIGQLQAEIETERGDKEAAETRLAELELEFEQLQAAHTAVRSQTPVPGTPTTRSVNGFGAATPLRAGSPLPVTPATARSKGLVTNTHLVSELSALRAKLDATERRNEVLTRELDEMVNDLENRAPEQDDFRIDKDRMEAEIVEMSSLLDASLAEKDSALAEARKWEGEATGFSKECNVLRQQLRDLSAQIKFLLVEMQARDQGLEMINAAGAAQLQLLAAGDLNEDAIDQTTAGALITQRLLLYRDVAGLQEQNVHLLKLNRGLADQMEGDEARAREAQSANSLRELENLQEKARRYEDEIRSLSTQAESITRERDMFRRMLAHRGPLPTNIDSAQSMFGQSIQGDGPPATPRASHRAADEDTQLSDYVKLVKELQTHVDTIRREASTDHGILRQQVDSLAKEKSDLQTELARNNGQITLVQERYDMLQKNYRMLQGENGELQKRSQILGENAAKQDIRTQQVAEELVDAKALVESMRAESSNLKAEKELWRNIETRLSEDNRQLMDERSRLNKMLADLQSLQNEREHADADTRRRLQARIDSLETDLSGVKKKLEVETEESKKAHLRREYEQDQSKTRIDDLIKSLSEAREELVAAKTMRDQLQSRVDEIKIDLRNAEERAQALQPRPTSGGPSTGLPESASVPQDGELTREQELGVEVADLKRDLELSRAELENAKSDVEQYKAISQAAEEELISLNATNDQYREDTDRQLAEKFGIIQQLEHRIEDITAELTTSNAELSELRTRHEESGMQLDAQKTALESDLARLRDECERQAEKAKMYQQDLKAQAEIAQQAQQSYEDELVKHADAAKNLQSVRTEYNVLRTDVASIRAEAEASKTSLSQGQDNWAELRDKYEKELHDVRASRNDLKAQNKLLHEQLESVGSQISALQQHRTLPTEAEEPSATNDNPGTKLQEVISYLRREKEIVDVQYELAMQESKRTKQQLDYVQSQLDETRLKLSEEQRQRTEHEANAMSHSKLLDTINELNLYRESSATLRQESRQSQAKLADKIKEVESLAEQILPLQSKIRELESELESKDDELKLLQEDRDRWRERTQNIISKYDRVDPAEIDAMKTRIGELEMEREQLLTTQKELEEKISEFPAQLLQTQEDAKKGWQEQREKLIAQAKERSRSQTARIAEVAEELRGTRAERDTLREQLAQTQQLLKQTTTALEEARVQTTAGQAATNQLASAQEGVALAAESEVAPAQEDGTDTVEGDQGVLSGTEASALNARIQEAEANANEYILQIENLQSAINELEDTIDAQKLQITELESQAAAPVNDDELANNRAELALARQELERLKSTSNAEVQERNDIAINADINNSSEEPLAAQAAQEVAAQVARYKAELDQQHEVSKKDLEETFNARTESMKNRLNQRLREDRAKMRDEVGEEIRMELIQQHSAELENLKQQHEQELETLRKQHEAIVERVTREGAEAVEEARQSTITSLQASRVDGEDTTASVSNGDQPGVELTDAQARELVAKNEIIRAIIKKNILAKVEAEKNKLREEHDNEVAEKIGELAEEHETALTALKETLQEEKTQAVGKAVNLETMKQKAKLGMAEGKANLAKAKLDIIETAARDTPQMAVGKVWEIAKAAKPIAATSTAAQTPPAPAVATSSATETPPTSTAAPSSITATPLDEEQLKKAAREARFGTSSISAAENAPKPTFGAPSFGAPSFGPSSAFGAPSAFGKPSFGQPSVPAPGMNSTEGGSGDADNKQDAGARSGLPRPSTSMLPRGGGGARGRGGIPQPSVQGSQIGRGQSGLPRGGRGGMNAGATQFVPGQQGAKRPLEGGDSQGDGKKMRGEGSSA